MDRAGFLYDQFLRRFPYDPTPCQDRLLRDLGEFLTGDDADILVVNKIDTLPVFDFDKDRMEKAVYARNPEMKIFYVSSLTGEGIAELADYLMERVKEVNS